jgi:hypothetical protein
MLFRALSVLFLILGIALAFATYTIERHEQRLRDGAIRTTGTVVNQLKRSGGEATIPVVRFVTADGDHVDFTATHVGRYAIGSTVPIYYHPDNPSFADVDTWRVRWQGTALAGAMSVFSLLIAGVLLRASRESAAPKST